VSIVGQRMRRPDAPDKVKGTALYVDDLAVAGALYGGVLRSPHPHARVVRLDASGARGVSGVHAVITASEIPGQNLIPMIQADWPVLAGEFVRHVGEPVALVAAETPETLKRALQAISVEYEPRAPLLDMEEALRAGEVLAHWKVRRGETQAALSRDDLVVVEGTWKTPYQEHAYIEPNGMIAMPDGTGGVTVMGSLQCPFYVQKAVASALGLDLNRVRIIQAVTGGGFGGKEDAPSSPGAHAALLAMQSGRPVRLMLSREETWWHVETPSGPREDDPGRHARGYPVAAEVDYLLTAGPTTLSPVVPSGHRTRLRPLPRPTCGSTRRWCAPTRSPVGPSAASVSRRWCSRRRA
jgi:CO/xanthine dehydrogenase Mo-binding subunit